MSLVTRCVRGSFTPVGWARMALAGLLALLASVGTPGSAAAASPGPSILSRVKAAGTVRVCIWPDYYGITYRHPRTAQLSGLDIDLAADLGRELGVKVEFIDSSFATLIADVKGDRCDVAMFAVGVLPQRAEHLRFTRPYLQSDIYAVTTKSNRAVQQWADIDKPGVAVAVQAGTFMEPVMQGALKQARLVSIKPPATRERELESGRVDVFMTDYPYSRRLLDNADWARLISPPGRFHPLPYAYAVRMGDDDWFNAVDTFVQRIRSDGRLDNAARRHGLSEVVMH